MDLQRLPLPVGSTHPVRRPGPAWSRRGWRRPLTALLGLAAAAAGAAFGASPATVTVSLDRDGYHVNDVRLLPREGGVYAGPEGAVVIVQQAGSTRASASTNLHGVHMLGACMLAAGATTERCTFRLGERTITAIDRLQGGGWDRRYSDGQSVRITLRGGRPVPVPIAIGR